MGNSAPAAISTHKDVIRQQQQKQDKSQLVFVREELARNRAEWHLSNEQKIILHDSWQVLEMDIGHVGTVTFLKMFETHPETLRAFIPEVEHIKEIELDEWYREMLKVHALRMMTVVEKVIHRLDNEEEAAMIMFTYGHHHCFLGVNSMMLDKMVQCFIIAIEPSFEERWTRQLEAAWLALFKRIVFFMRLGYPMHIVETASSDE